LVLIRLLVFDLVSVKPRFALRGNLVERDFRDTPVFIVLVAELKSLDTLMLL